MAAGKTFQEKLGDDYYPLHLGAYDRMILMVFYLESKYGKDWADPITSTLNYTRTRSLRASTSSRAWSRTTSS